MELLQAMRKEAVIKMGLLAPSGGGKTYSALLLAFGLAQDWGKIAVIDTENNSSHLYSHLGNYNVLGLSEPFSPERYIQAIEACEQAGMKVIIIDSISAEWEGSSGIIETHGNMAGNSFTNWNKITPRHNAFVQKMLQSPCHLIATIRSKQDYVLTDKNGRLVPEKVGLKGITRDGMDYEFTVVFDLDIKHQATASKDRTGLFMDKPQFVITKATGELIRNWCLSGFNLSDIEDEIDQCTTIEGLRHILMKYQEYRKKIEPSVYRRKAQIDALTTAVNS